MAVDMTYEWIPSPNFKSGRTARIQSIVIHHWDDPAKKPKLAGVVNHFKDPKVQVAAHYVVTDDRVIQMVKESDTAWQARQANPFTIGIEVDPQVPGDTYKTVGHLVRDIRRRYGNLPLKKHSDFVKTTCPGNLDLGLIERYATFKEDTNMPLTTEQVDKAFKMARRSDPTAEELGNTAYAADAGLLIDTLWENGGREAYEAAQEPGAVVPPTQDQVLGGEIVAKIRQIQ